MQRHTSPLTDLKCSYWQKQLKTVNPKAFSGPSRISKMELFVEKVNGFESLIIFVKSSILVFSFWWNSESNYIEWQLSRGVLKESCFENLIYFLKYVLELSCRNEDKIPAKYRKGVILETLKLILRNDF